MRRVRLLKVQVQPVFVMDDGDTLTEIAQQPRLVTATEWPTYASALEELRAKLEAQINAETKP